VPDLVCLQGEVRSLDRAKADRFLADLRAAFEVPAAEAGGSVTLEAEEDFPGYRLDDNDPVVAMASRALARAGRKAELGSTLAGTDGAHLVSHGIACAVVCRGVEAMTEERVRVDDFLTYASLVPLLAQEHAAAPAV
jgi:tripeptide aminopeptidase